MQFLRPPKSDSSALSEQLVRNAVLLCHIAAAEGTLLPRLQRLQPRVSGDAPCALQARTQTRCRSSRQQANEKLAIALSKLKPKVLHGLVHMHCQPAALAALDSMFAIALRNGVRCNVKSGPDLEPERTSQTSMKTNRKV